MKINKLAPVNKFYELNYKETLEFLFSQLPMYHRIGPAAYKASLDTTLELDRIYMHPHNCFKSVHVAGTNGKGSVSHMLAAILQTAGYKTGLYTSPHLIDFRERIRVNGKMIPESEVEDWVGEFRRNSEVRNLNASFFELTVALAFDYFRKERVDIAVVEVGLGGRLDSTNIIRPEVSVITNIGLDHTALLGDSLEKIAGEKAGIIKEGVAAVVGTSQPETNGVFIEKAGLAGAPLFFADKEYLAEYSLLSTDSKQVFQIRTPAGLVYPDLKIDLLGTYQRKNLPAVLKTCDLLVEKGWSIQRDNIYEGLSAISGLTGLKGRWQVIGANPMIVCDTGHNTDGMKAILEQINQTAFRNLHMILGFVNDKDISGMLKLLPRKCTYYFTKADLPRAFDETILTDKGREIGLEGKSYSSTTEAFNAARRNAGVNDLIFIGGSTFVVAEILQQI